MALVPLFLFSCQEEPMMEVNCVTKDASQVTYTDAVLKGSVSVKYLNAVARASFCYVSDDELKEERVTSLEVSSVIRYGQEVSVCSVTGESEVLLNVKNLQVGTVYYYVLLVRVGQDIYFGDIKSFQTNNPVSRLMTENESVITQTKAVLEASITIDQDTSFPVETSIYYSETENTLEGLLANGTMKPTIFDRDQCLISVELSSLKLATQYHYVFCCNVGGKAIYSDVATFNTIDVVTNTSSVKAARVLLTTATLRGLSVYETDEANYSWEHEGWFYYSTEESSLEGLQSRGTRVAATNNEDGSFTAVLTGLTPGTSYYYVACSVVNGKEQAGQVCSFETKTSIPEEAIDLGLSVLWLGCNLGASSPEESGDYYAWGETTIKDHYNEYNYVWGEDWYLMKKYNSRADRGTVDNKSILDSDDDVVHKTMGGYWRIPTYEEMAELVENCIMVRKRSKGIWGYEFTSKLNGKQLFFPQSGFWLSCAEPNNVGEIGYYWTSSLETEYPNLAYYLRIEKDHEPISSAHRCSGMTIRPVWE